MGQSGPERHIRSAFTIHRSKFGHFSVLSTIMSLSTPSAQTDSGLLISWLEKLIGTYMVYLFGLAIYNRYFHPLKDIPGPFWASISPLWLYRAISLARWEEYQLPIHKRYGSMVRLAPNHVQFSDPEAVDTIYGTKHNMAKSDFYAPFDSKISPTPDTFCSLDNATHDRRRRAVAPLYTQGAVLSYEPCVDRCIDLFQQRMEEIVDSKETSDMAMWFRRYTFDVIGEIFYGQKGGFGFLRDQVDYNDWGTLLEVLNRPITATSYAPYGFKNISLLVHMLFPESRAGVLGYFKVIRQSRDALKRRLDDIAAYRQERHDDILSKLINVAQKNGEKYKFSLLDVTTEIYAVIFAGADTTATALTAIFYYMHRNPEVLAKVKTEIDDAFKQGKLSFPIRFSDANKLPYLRAVILEAFRIHPSTGLSLPRVVPDRGVEICGKYFPGGTVVAMNAAAVHYDTKTFGEDSEEYIPERWIRDGDKAASSMERHLLQFGYGKRICLGKHISYTEMFKLIPTILHKFNFELVGDKPWTVRHEWFQQQKDVYAKATKRNLDPAEQAPRVKLEKMSPVEARYGFSAET